MKQSTLITTRSTRQAVPIRVATPQATSVKTGHMSFIGRRRLLEQCRQAVEAGQHVWLCGEVGIGKTSLARRVCPDALYVANVTPIKEMLSQVLLQCFERGWYQPGLVTEGDEEQVERLVRRLDYKSAARAAAQALQGKNAVLILDDFESATPTTLRVARSLAEAATLIVCAASARPTLLPFLFGFAQVDVPRLTQSESKELALRLLSEHGVSTSEQPRLLRHLIEEAQGLPRVTHELVRRAAIKGDVSLRTVRQEPISGHKQIDMTPALVVFVAVLVGLRFVVRGMGDSDLTMVMGGAGVLFILVRLYAGRLSGGRR